MVATARRRRGAIRVGTAWRQMGGRRRRRPSCSTRHRRAPEGHSSPGRTASPTTRSQLIGGMPVTTPARTAFDLACRYPAGKAVAAIDALARATRLKAADVELIAERYKGHRNIRRARRALHARRRRRRITPRDLVTSAAHRGRLSAAADPDPGLWTEYGELVAIVDMGWEDIKIALEYEGDHHRTDRTAIQQRHRALRSADADLGWIAIRVTAEDAPGGILRAWRRPGRAEREAAASFQCDFSQ